MSYAIGSQFRTSLEVYNSSDELVDPSGITLTITLPDRTTEVPTVAHDGVGLYHYDYPFEQEGLHKFSWATTGPITHQTDYANAAEWRSILGLDETKEYIGETDSNKDPILRHILMAATELAEDIVGVCVPKTFTNEKIFGTSQSFLRMPHTPLPDDEAIESITSVWASGPSWATADLVIFPDSGTCTPLSMIPFWQGPWKATYTAGRIIVPESIQLAVKEIVYDLWAIQRSYGALDLEPGPEETARWEQMLSNYQMPPHAKAQLEINAQPGFA